jgi:hypothetical protein
VKSPTMQEIHSLEQLRAIDRDLGVFALVKPVRYLKFAVAGVSEERNLEASEKIAKYQKACGCFAGGITMGLCFLAYIVFLIVSGETLLNGGAVLEILFSIALFLGSTLVGKALGRLWAKVQMIRLIRRLARCADWEALGAAS